MEWLNAIVGGGLTGGAYAIMGVSITLMYRSTGTLSFAHAAFAALAAYIYSDLTVAGNWSVGLAAAIAMVVTLVYGLLVERVVMRPVAGASATSRMIATLAVLGATSAAMLLVYGSLPQRAPQLLPPGGAHLLGGSVFVGYQELFTLFVAAVAGAALAWFLRASRLGVAVRAASDNVNAARLMGVSPTAVSRLNWLLAAAASGAAGILIAPSTLVSVATFPVMELRALTGAMFGGLGSLVLTFVGGVVLGIIEALATLELSGSGIRELVALLTIVAILLVRRSWYVPSVDEHGYATAETVSSKRGAGAGRRPVRIALIGGVALFFAFRAIFDPASSNFDAFIWSVALFYLMQGLSLVVLSGWGGQITLMQAAYAGLGAYSTLYVVQYLEWPPEVGILLSTVIVVAAGAVVGVPALRVKGPQFAIVSLGFGAWAASWLFTKPVFQASLPRTSLFGIDITSDKPLYVITVVSAAVVFLLVWNLRRSQFGTLLITARDRGDMIAQFGQSPNRTRMTAFLFASGIAGFSGALYGLLLTGFRPTDFGLFLSINLLLFTVAGGIRSLVGPLIAALAFQMIPAWLQGPSDTGSGAQITQLVGAGIVVALIALRPDGLASLLPRRRRSDKYGPTEPPSPLVAQMRAGGVRRGRVATAALDVSGHKGNGRPPRSSLPTGSLSLGADAISRTQLNGNGDRTPMAHNTNSGDE